MLATKYQNPTHYCISFVETFLKAIKKKKKNRTRDMLYKEMLKSKTKQLTQFQSTGVHAFTFFFNKNRTIRSDHPGNTHGRGEEAPSGSRSRADECEFRDTITCDKFSKYRTINGSCNNLANPYWGMAETPLVRFACFAYDDGELHKVSFPFGKY